MVISSLASEAWSGDLMTVFQSMVWVSSIALIDFAACRLLSKLLLQLFVCN